MTINNKFDFCKELVHQLEEATPLPNGSITRSKIVLLLLDSEYAGMFNELEPIHITQILGISDRDYKLLTKQAIRKIKALGAQEQTKDIRELVLDIEELLYTDMTDNSNKD